MATKRKPAPKPRAKHRPKEAAAVAVPPVETTAPLPSAAPPSRGRVRPATARHSLSVHREST